MSLGTFATNALVNNLYLELQTSVVIESELSGETEASNAEEQLARDNRIRYQGIQGRLYASPVLPQIPRFPAMPPKTLGSGAKPQSESTLNQNPESPFQAEPVHCMVGLV